MTRQYKGMQEELLNRINQLEGSIQASPVSAAPDPATLSGDTMGRCSASPLPEPRRVSRGKQGFELGERRLPEVRAPGTCLEAVRLKREAVVGFRRVDDAGLRRGYRPPSPLPRDRERSVPDPRTQPRGPPVPRGGGRSCAQRGSRGVQPLGGTACRTVATVVACALPGHVATPPPPPPRPCKTSWNDRDWSSSKSSRRRKPRLPPRTARFRR